MKYIAACAVLTGIGCLLGVQTQANPLPQEWRATLPIATLSGQAKMTFLGFEVYQATLWVSPGFVDTAYDQSAFALELAYLRDFKGAAIARRSIAEMRRQALMGAEQEARWEAQMLALFPDVKAGDRIIGVHQPGSGAVFYCNGRLLGDIRNPAFAKLFFGIWLAPQTSAPLLRQALLTQAKARASGGTPP